jgi:hypothetical protein
MDVLAAGTVIKYAGVTYRGWGVFKKWWFGGNISITHPQNNAIVSPGAVIIEGLHKKTLGHYWLLTVNHDDHWIQRPVNLLPDGTWRETIHIGGHRGPREAVLILVRASTFVDAIFQDIKKRSNKAKDWSPLTLASNGRQFSIVQGIVLRVT